MGLEGRRSGLPLVCCGGKELEGKGRVYGVDKLEFVSLELGFDWYGKELGCFGRGGGGGRGMEEREEVRRLG